jgi:hypothetical protein
MPPNEALLTARHVLKDRSPLVVALADRLAALPRMTGEEVEALLSRAAECKHSPLGIRCSLPPGKPGRAARAPGRGTI